MKKGIAFLSVSASLFIILSLLVPRGVSKDAAAATPLHIDVGPNIAITTDPLAQRNEDWIAADPTNAQHLIAAVTTLRDRDDGFGGFDTTHVSFDGGNTWQEVDNRPNRVTGSGDPQVTFSATGRPIFVTLPFGPVSSVWYSSSQGRSWQASSAPKIHDHERVGVDMNPSSPYHGRIYIASEGSAGPGRPGSYGNRAIVVTYSDDGGKTFHPQTFPYRNIDFPASSPYRNKGDEVDSVQILHDGTVVIGITHYVSMKLTRRPYRVEEVGVIESHDGGKTFGKQILFGRFGRHDYRFAGPDGTRSISHFGMMELASDQTTGRYRDRLYAIYQVTPTPARNYLQLVYSSNGGKTWSAPRNVDTANMSGDDYQPQIAVNNQGVVGVFFYNSNTNALSYDRFDAYFAASTDGGQTFTRPVRVSSQTSYPNLGGSDKPFVFSAPSHSAKGMNVMLGSSGIWDDAGGHYIGMTADANGVFHPAWCDARSGVFQLFTTAISVSSNVTARPAFSGVQNLNSALRTVIERPQYDASTKTVLLPIRLQNTSANAITGPVTLRLTTAVSRIFAGAGPPVGILTPSADYSRAFGSAGILPPHGVSEPIVWRLRTQPSMVRFINLTFTATGRTAR